MRVGTGREFLRLMTLGAGGVAQSTLIQLIVGPFRRGTRIGFALMDLMARKAGHRAVHMAARIHHSRVLAPRDPRDTVRPKHVGNLRDRLFRKRFLLGHRPDLRLRGRVKTDHLSHREQIYDWPNPWVPAYWGNDDTYRLPAPSEIDYVVLDRNHVGQAQQELLADLVGPDGEFEVLFDESDVVVGRRRPASP